MDGTLDPPIVPSILSKNARQNACAFIVATVALHTLAFVVFAGRMWSRSNPVLRMYLDDCVCIFAYILVVISSVLLLMTVPFAFSGDPNAFSLMDAQVALKYAIVSQPFWAWSMATIKSSFALMLLRIEQTLCRRRFLWIMIIIQIFIAVYNTFCILLQCVPIYKAWDLLGTVPGTCWSKDAQSTNTIIVAVFSIITDFIFAALPISLLRKIQRPLRERIIVGVLMGLGVFAGISSIVKITAAAQFGRTDDMTSESIKIGMWSVIEELVGFIAICVPCLRLPVQRAVQTFGGMTSRIRSRFSVIMERSRSSDMGFKLSSLQTELSSKDAQWDNPAVRTPCEIWCTKEVVVDHDRLSRMPSDEWPNAGPNAIYTNHDFWLEDVQMGRTL